MTPYTSAILAKDVQKILETRTEEVEAGVRNTPPRWMFSAMPIDSSARALKLALIDKGERPPSPTAWRWNAGPCWVRPSAWAAAWVIGMLADLGIPCACESDVLGAVSAVMLGRDAGRSPSSLRTSPCAMPTTTTPKLFWHCGPFPVSLAHPGSKPAIAEGGQGHLSCATAM